MQHQQTQLKHTLEEFPRLAAIAKEAKKLYDSAGLLVHNYEHAAWDTERIIEIAVAEDLPANVMEDAIIAGLLHDVGVSKNIYREHALYGAQIAFDILEDYDPERAVAISNAILWHNDGEPHEGDIARILHDADTLNKAGEHGIRQCFLVASEFDFLYESDDRVNLVHSTLRTGNNLGDMKHRFLPMYESLCKIGYYFPSAKEIDKQMGSPAYSSGLELARNFWSIVIPESYVMSKQDPELIRKALISCRCPNEQS
jgi:hypothetical protein